MTVTVTELGDEQLVEAVRAGDEAAFGTLFERYSDSLVRYVASMVPGGPDQAEDVIQDVFASALTSMRSSDRPIIFKPWIYRIAKNACIDRHRRSSRYTAVSLDTAELGTRDENKLSAIDTGPETVIDNRESINSLRKAFSGLEQSHHEILVLREFEGKSYDKIGDQMGLSPAAVQSALFRARRRLRTEYDDITTGRRCETVQSTLDEGVERNGAIRKRRKILTHMHDCAACRRHAAHLGMTELIADSSRITTLRARAAALLPLPLAHKFATGAVAAVVLVGGGYAVEGSGIGPTRDRSVDATVVPSSGAGDQSQLQNSGAETAGQRARRSARDGRSGGSKPGSDRPSAGQKNDQPGVGAPSNGPGSASGSGSANSGSGSKGGGALGGAGSLGSGLPATPSTDQVLDDVHNTVGSVGETVGGTGLPGSDTVEQTVGQVNSNTQQLESQTKKTVGGVVGGLGQ